MTSYIIDNIQDDDDNDDDSYDFPFSSEERGMSGL